MTGTNDSGGSFTDWIPNGTRSRLALVSVGIAVLAVAGVGSFVLGFSNLPIDRPQATFDLQRGETVRLVHGGGDDLNSSHVVVSRNGTWNSTWQSLAGWDEPRNISHQDAVPLPGVERGEMISVRYVYHDERLLLFRERV